MKPDSVKIHAEVLKDKSGEFVGEKGNNIKYTKAMLIINGDAGTMKGTPEVNFKEFEGKKVILTLITKTNQKLEFEYRVSNIELAK